MDRRAYYSKVPDCPGCRQRERRIVELQAEVVRLNQRLDEQDKLIAQLKASVEELRRASKRQAAPFSKGSPKAEPKAPGRKPGELYGRQGVRNVPPKIDEVFDAVLPEVCPHCGCRHIRLIKVGAQYQVDIPRRPIFRQFNIAVGECVNCGCALQGRHPLQTSDALGAAASQIGPEAQSAIALMNKELGLSHGKVARFFQALFGIEISRSGVCRIMLRSAARLEGDYNDIVRSIQNSGPMEQVVSDETGWRIGGRGAWLHVAVGVLAVAYLIDRSRGIEAIVRLLGTMFHGTLCHDGFCSYVQFNRADHQACLGHLLRRCAEMLEQAVGSAAEFPRRVKGLLQESLEIRDQRDAEQIAPVTAALKGNELQQRMGELTRAHKTNPDNERLAKHLRKNLPWLFTFLRMEGIDATNHKAEQAIRPAVVNRKVWGGNRTEAGARAQSILMSVLATCRKQGRDAMDYIDHKLRGVATMPLLGQPAPSG